MNVDDLLKQYGLKFEDLNTGERETFNTMVETMQQGQLTLEKFKDYIDSMLQSVVMEVSNYDNGSKQDTYVKARIRNYVLLQAFLQTPEKAKKALQRALGNIK